MSDTDKRYFDLKGDTTRVEINVQELDRPLVVTGPVSVDASDGSTIYALEMSPGVKEITADVYASSTDVDKLTVAQLDGAYGETDGYPANGSKGDKVAFVKALTEEED